MTEHEKTSAMEALKAESQAYEKTGNTQETCSS